MIKADLYPTSTTYGDGTLEVTDLVSNLTLDDPAVDPLKAYYMGPINTKCMYNGNFRYTGSGADRHYYLTENEGYDRSWAWVRNPGGSGYYFTDLQWNTSRWQASSMRFINNMNAYKLNRINSFTISGYMYDFSTETILGTGEKIRTCETRTSFSDTKTLTTIYNFIARGGAFTFTVSGDTYTFTKDDYDENEWCFKSGTKRFYITNCQLASGNTYNAVYFNGSNLRLGLMVGMNIENISNPKLASFFHKNFGEYIAPDYRLRLDTDELSTSSILYDASTFKAKNSSIPSLIKPFDVSYVAANYAATYHSGHYYYVLNSNGDIMHNSGSDQVYINNMCNLEDWFNKIFICVPKMTTSRKNDGSAGTSMSNTQAYYDTDGVPIYNPDNKIQDIIKRDTYPQLEPQLREWQKYGHDIDENDYDPDSSSGDDPDQTDPDDITPTDREDTGPMTTNEYNEPYTISNFITGYGLNPVEVQSVGDTLWRSLSSTSKNMMKNFYLFSDQGYTNEEYYFTMSDIINYFISLRWYPFDINSVFTTSSNNNLCVGGGTYPLLTGVDKIGRWRGIIQCGSIKIPKPAGFYEFEPYATATIFVPFCGSIDIEPSIIYGRTITLTYCVDACTGECTAYICANLDGGGSFVLASMTGTIGFDILLTSNNAQTVSARAINSQYTFRLDHAQSMVGAIGTAINSLSKNNPVSGAKTIGSEFVNTAFDIGRARLNQPLLTGLSPLTCGSSAGLSGTYYLTPCIQIRLHSMWNKGNAYEKIGYISDRNVKIEKIKAGTFFTCINPNLTDNCIATQEELNMISECLSQGVFK